MHLTFSQHPALDREYRGLLRETDTELRDEGLLALARRLEQRGDSANAAALYGEVLRSDGPMSTRAASALEVLNGRGALGARSEIWLRNFSQQVTDPANLVAMGIAGSVFRAVRLGSLARLRSLSWSGGGARLAAGLAGLALEAPAFALSARAGADLLGRPQDWNGSAVGRDIAAAYMTLSGLRAAAGLGRLGLSGLGPRHRASPLLQLAVGQSSLLGGILLAHSLEAKAGLRRQQSGGEALVEGLATLLQFQVAGRLSRELFGANFARWERRMDTQTEQLSFRAERGILADLLNAAKLGQGSLTVFGMTKASYGLQSPSAIPRTGPRSRQLFDNVMQMSGKNPLGRGPHSSDSGIRPAVTVETAAPPDAQALLQGIGNPEGGLRTLLNSLPVAATVSRVRAEDGQLRATIANAQFLRLFTYSERELAQHPLTHYLSQNSAPIAASRLWTIMRGGVFKATAVDFQARFGVHKLWVSGVVRTAYGEDYAITFYQARDVGETAPPQPLPALKAVQLADGSRRLDLDPQGFYELRSAFELCLQLTNPDSPLLRHLRQGDVELRLPEAESAGLQALAPALERSLNHWATSLGIAAGRSLSVNGLRFVNGGQAFSLSDPGRPSSPSQIDPYRPIVASIVNERTPVPSERTPLPRPKPGGIFETVQKALAGIGGGEENGESGKPPQK